MAGLRERKKRKTRAALAAEALRLFAERGFDATTIDDIAEAVDVSRSTYFRYFSTKEDVVFFDHDEKLALFRDLLAAREPGESTAAVIGRAALAVARAFSEDLRRQPAETRLRRQLMTNVPSLVARDLQLDLDWEAAMVETLRPELGELHARLLAGASMGAIRAVLRTWEAGDYGDELEALTTEALRVLERGFGRAAP